MSARILVVVMLTFSPQLMAQKISMNGDGSATLPDSLLAYKQLVELELIDFKLSRLPKELLSLPDLRKLTLTNNSPKRRLKLSKNTTIKTLVIRDDKHGKLPRSYKAFTGLE